MDYLREYLTNCFFFSSSLIYFLDSVRQELSLFTFVLVTNSSLKLYLVYLSHV